MWPIVTYSNYFPDSFYCDLSGLTSQTHLRCYNLCKYQLQLPLIELFGASVSPRSASHIAKPGA